MVEKNPMRISPKRQQTVVTTVRLSGDVKEALTKAAEADTRSQAAMIELLLREGLVKRGFLK